MHQLSLVMEAMTKRMKKISEKTAIQTLSMHIITLVTLFFLLAAFLAERVFDYHSFLSMVYRIPDTK